MDKINKDVFENSFQKIIDSLENHVNQDGTKDTPKRVAKAYEELLSGYTTDIKKVINNALFDVKYDEIIIVRNIKFFSLCEHHMLPFFGKIDVGYLPDDKIIGLSKIPRITKIFSRRLQVQERLTKEIGEAIFKNTNALGAGVVIKAQHMCSSMRGVNLPETEMVTSSLFGSFKSDNATRKEFFDLIK